jgi:hypothetical protein
MDLVELLREPPNLHEGSNKWCAQSLQASSAGLGHAQLTHALEWYRDNVRSGADGANLGESFNDFARSKGWTPEQFNAAVGVYSQIQHEGPAAVLATPSAEDDAGLIAKADELLPTNPSPYWADEGLQELALEARERQQAAPQADPAVDDYAIERRLAERGVDKFAAMLRDPGSAAKYWASPDPCNPTRATQPPSGPDWVHEIKHDGYRLIVRRDGLAVRLFTGRGDFLATTVVRGKSKRSRPVGLRQPMPRFQMSPARSSAPDRRRFWLHPQLYARTTLPKSSNSLMLKADPWQIR